MKKLFFCITAFVIFIGRVHADEGMLIPSLISAFESDMKAKGMKLSAQDIYNVNKASIKDAILQFGGGCTAERAMEEAHAGKPKLVLLKRLQQSKISEVFSLFINY